MLFTGVKDAIALTTHTLTPRQDKQVRFYNGSGSSKITVTLNKSNAKEGDFFILYFNCNTTGTGLAIVQEGSGSEIWSNYSTGAFTSKLICSYTGSTWKVLVLENTFASRAVAPTTGTHVVGDFYPNNLPTELGTAGSKYIIRGMRCITAGTPGTWVEERTLTGN